MRKRKEAIKLCHSSFVSYRQMSWRNSVILRCIAPLRLCQRSSSGVFQKSPLGPTLSDHCLSCRSRVYPFKPALIGTLESMP